MEGEDFQDAYRLFSAAGNYKNAAELRKKCKSGKKYMDAMDYLEDGELEKARKALSSIDPNYKETTKFLSLIDDYSKYNGSWDCVWGEGEGYGRHIYNDDSENYEDDIRIRIAILRTGTIGIIVEDYEGAEISRIAKIEGNKILWNGYDGSENFFDLTTGQRDYIRYDDNGNLEWKALFRYRKR